jgi:hypothetical protein
MVADWVGAVLAEKIADILPARAQMTVIAPV